MNIIINELTDKDDKKAYARTKEIAAASESSPEYYSCLESFASLLNDKKAYIRTRAFILCCSQARWDNEGKLKQLLPALMVLFHDIKPTVVISPNTISVIRAHPKRWALLFSCSFCKKSIHPPSWEIRSMGFNVR